MNYTLITSTGKIFTFFILAVAKTYQQAYGGQLLTNAILTQTVTQTATVAVNA